MIKHTLLALIMQAALWLALGDLLVGAITASVAFLLREITQAEYHWMVDNNKKRSETPWYIGVFHKSFRTRKSLTDWIVPAAVVWTVAVVGMYLGL